MHFARLVEQASATGFYDLFVFGAYMVHCPGMFCSFELMSQEPMSLFLTVGMLD